MTSILIIEESSSNKYAPRTIRNANEADLTLAFAFDFNTAGEKLTKNAAGSKYLNIKLPISPDSVKELILEEIVKRKVKILNVAGNGIYTLLKSNWSQKKINIFLYIILEYINSKYKIEKVISGGQTGVDIAGIVAAYSLGIDSEVILPKGFLQRNSGGQDIQNSRDEIEKQIVDYSSEVLEYFKKDT